MLALLGSLASATLLAACSASSDASAGGEVGTPDAQAKEVIFWGHEQHPLDLAAEGFVEVHPEIRWVSPHPADWVDKLQIAMASDSGCPDLVWAEVLQAQNWGCNDLLTDLTDVLRPQVDNYHPLKLNETLIAKTGHNIGWPGDISVSGWYYHANKLAEAGYGSVDFGSYTWDDFYVMAADLKSQDLYAFAFPADGWSALYMFALHQLGGTAVSQDGQQITIGSDEGLRAMQIVKNLWDAGGLDVEWWSAAYWAALKEGQLVGDFAAAWARGFWEAQLADSADVPETSMWRVAKLPGGDGIHYRTGVWLGWQLVNPKAGINDQNALDFMQYALGSTEGTAPLWSMGHCSRLSTLSGRPGIFGTTLADLWRLGLCRVLGRPGKRAFNRILSSGWLGRGRSGHRQGDGTDPAGRTIARRWHGPHYRTGHAGFRAHALYATAHRSETNALKISVDF